jgi:colanic acid/amylovoran biosynthesis protein
LGDDGNCKKSPLAERVPSVAITYGGNKGQGIMSDLGLSDYAISISEFNAEKVIHTFTKLSENREQVRSHLTRCKLQIEEKYLKLVDMAIL